MIFLKIETESISYALENKILSIQVKKTNEKVNDETRIWKSWEFSNEFNLINNFTKWFLNEEDKIFLGFNILKFDIPLLLMKTQKLENFSEFSLKINRSNILDLFVILTFIHRGKIKSFQDYCREINVLSVSREEILILYKEKNYDDLEKALIKNLDAMQSLFLNVVERLKK